MGFDKSLEVPRGNAKIAAEPGSPQLAIMNPPADGGFADLQKLGDLMNGEKRPA